MDKTSTIFKQILIPVFEETKPKFNILSIGLLENSGYLVGLLMITVVEIFGSSIQDFTVFLAKI